MLEWYISNKTLIDFIIDFITIVGFITTIYAIYNIVVYLRKRKLQNKINEIQRDGQSYDVLSRKLEEYIGAGGRDYGIRLVFYKNYPYNLEKDGFRKYLFWYKFSENSIPSGYISNTSIAIIEYVSFAGDRIYYNSKTHKWFVDSPKKQFKKYRELPYEMMIYHIPFQNILGYRFGASDWTDKYEPIFFTKFRYNSWKLFNDDMIAVRSGQCGKFPLDQLVLSKVKRVKRYKYLLNRASFYSHCIKRIIRNS